MRHRKTSVSQRSRALPRWGRAVGVLPLGILLFSAITASAQQKGQTPKGTPDVVGKISAISADGSSITFGERKRIVIKITKKTSVLLEGSKARQGDKKLRVGQQVKIW